MHALTAIPALRDNYIWRLASDHGDYLLVDPGSPEVLEQLEHAPAAILITHLHRDHIDALAPLRQRWPDIPVFGPPTLRQLIEDCQSVVHQQVLELAGFAPILVLEVPGHTLDHVAYVVQQQPMLLFCGDTLFSAGCGRLFEGTAEQMHASLQMLSALPADTLVCPAHEYTLANLKFARMVEPDNHLVVDYLQRCELLRDQQRPTVPSTIACERQINPFLRVHEGALQQRWQQPNALQLFAMLRQWKNTV